MTSDFGNRHQGNLDGKLLRSSPSGQVRISAGGLFAKTQGGQHLLWMLVNLLARQYDVVTSLEIAVPAVDLCPFTAPFGSKPNLQTTLMETAALVAAGKMSIQAAAAPVSQPNYASIECVGVSNSAWAATADGWNLHVGPEAVPESLPVSPLSIGPYFAACVLASEVFKTIRGYDPSRRRVAPLILSLWTLAAYDDPTQVPEAPRELAPVPSPYLVGAGAVGQALAATLITSRIGPPEIITIDGDAIDDELTNLNRYCLTIATDRNQNKADLLSEFFKHAGVTPFSFPVSWAEYVQSKPHNNIPSGMRSAERESRYEYIISCVDINTSRHELQKMWPRLIIGASTLGLGATVQIYDLRFNQECLMCANPIETDEWTLEGEVKRLRQLPKAERAAEAGRVGADAELLEAHLADPRCGTLGESELSKFKPSASRHDWSVGFVSVGAGVMLAAVLLRYFSAPPGEDEPQAFRFSFETNCSGKSTHRPAAECECQRRGKEYWRQLWSGRLV